MNYELLNVELANVECEKALLMCEAYYELNDADMFAEEDEEKFIDNSMTEFKNLVDKVKESTDKHLADGDKPMIRKKDAAKYKKTCRAVRMLKNAVTSPYYWAFLGPGGSGLVGEIGDGIYRSWRNDGDIENGEAAPVVSELKDLGVIHIEDDYWEVAKQLEAARANGEFSNREYAKRMRSLHHALNLAYRSACWMKDQRDNENIRLVTNEKGRVKRKKNG